MANEETRAAMSRTRGEVGAGVKDPAARKKFIARQGNEEAKGKQDMSGLSEDAFRQRNVNVAGSFKHGTDYVPKTANYKLHKGEKVIPAPRASEDFRSEYSRMEGVKGGGPLKYDTMENKVAAHGAARAAGGFSKHGPNDNMVRDGSAARAPHDKD